MDVTTYVRMAVGEHAGIDWLTTDWRRTLSHYLEPEDLKNFLQEVEDAYEALLPVDVWQNKTIEQLVIYLKDQDRSRI